MEYVQFTIQSSDQRHSMPDQDQSSMLKVICSQRDRFRARLRETEEVYSILYLYFASSHLITFTLNPTFVFYQEIRHLKENIRMITVDLEKTKADNVKLYGKIRYVQDYSNEKLVSRGPKKVCHFLIYQSYCSY